MKARSAWSAALSVSVSFLGCDGPTRPREAAPPQAPATAATAAPAAAAAPPAAVAVSPNAEPGGPADPAPEGSASRRVTVEGKAMGTHVLLATFTTDELDEALVRERLEAALAEIRRLELLMTTWRDDSEIERINAAAGGSPVPVGPETLAVVQKSLWIGEKSGGVFDITFEVMKNLWKFDENREEKVPSKTAVERARKLIDYRKIEVDPARGTVRLAKPGMRIGLGGIAKGYAVDAAAKLLRARGLRSFFVQAGGDLYVAGRKPDGKAYRVGIRDPRGAGPHDYFALLEVEDRAFSTAGDYERSFVKDGRRFHHILDPRTGEPATKSRSVTVWADDALTADAIDDAVFILGPEEGMKIVEATEGCGAVVVDDDNRVHVSRRLAGKLEILRPPTDGP